MTAVIAAIPVRLDSRRVSRKALAPVQGQPLLWHVWQCARAADCFDEVLIVSDSDEVARLAQGWGASALHSPAWPTNGTERLAVALGDRPDLEIVNIQADMPRLAPTILRAVADQLAACAHAVITPVYRIRDPRELFSPHVVKVVRAACGQALYFSRQPIPHLRDVPEERWIEHAAHWGHIGVYGYSSALLQRYLAHPPVMLEELERLEQLRFLSAGIPVLTVETPDPPITVDCVDDLARLERAWTPTGDRP